MNRAIQKYYNSLKVALKTQRNKLILLMAILIIAAILPAAQAAAQTSPFDWSFPMRITERQEQTSEPFLVADQSGLLHLFWSPHNDGPQSLYYTQWDGRSWSEPQDIYNGTQISGPSAVVDTRGTIHLIWSDGNTIYYSQAPVKGAISAANWSVGEGIASGYQQASILIDRQDHLYLVYPGLSSSGPAMITSEDGGYSWSSESRISQTNSADAGANYLEGAIGPDGTIHVVWVEFQLPLAWPPLGLYYSHSNDGGLTWSRALEMATENFNQIKIVVTEENEVHCAWNGSAGTGGRYHRWSPDGGETWGNTNEVIPAGFGGSEGAPQLAVDSLGTLHLVTTYDQRVWYAFFQGMRWSQAQILLSGDENGIPPVGQFIDPKTLRHIEHPTMALNTGNQLHVVFWDERPSRNMIQYWYTTKQTSASALELIPFPSPTAIATLVRPTDNPDTLVAIPTPTLDFDTSPEANKPIQSTGWPVIAAILPVALLVSVVLFVKINKLTRKK